MWSFGVVDPCNVTLPSDCTSLLDMHCVSAQQHTSTAASKCRVHMPEAMLRQHTGLPNQALKSVRPCGTTVLSQLSLHADNCKAWTAHSS